MITGSVTFRRHHVMGHKGLKSQSIIYESLSGCFQEVEGERKNEGNRLKRPKPNPNLPQFKQIAFCQKVKY